jgi:hypothetical protein
MHFFYLFKNRSLPFERGRSHVSPPLSFKTASSTISVEATLPLLKKGGCGGPSSNGNSAARTASMSINGDKTITLSFASTYRGGLISTLPLIVHLKSGENTIKFFNTTTWAPDIDRITIVG